MSELKPLEERIKNLAIGLLGMADGETIQVNKSFLEHVRADMVELSKLRRAQPANEPLVTCGECVKYQTPNCAVKHEQALMDFCSHGIRKPGGEQE